ncbi:MAG TPA: hypothetical protein VIL46_06855, partial [Gemmataceae bacterium]
AWPSYFPPNKVRGRSEEFAQFLRRMEEPPLYPVAPDQPLTIRLLCLPTWAEPCSVRLEARGLSFRLWGRELSGEAGFEVGRLTRCEARLLGEEEAGRARLLWNYLQFWSLAEEKPEPEVFDGTTYVLEAAEHGHYHIVERPELEWGSTINEFAELLQQLAGFRLR